VPDWVLLAVGIVAAIGALLLIGYAMGEAARDRRMRDELLHGWWNVGAGYDNGEQDQDE